MTAMTGKVQWVAAGVVALGVGAWFAKDLPVVQRLLGALPAGSAAAIGGPELKTPEQAGLRKCRTGARVVYSDQPCPAGSREEKIQGGSVNVVNLPKPTPAPAAAAASGGIIQGFDQATIDRMREQQIDAAMKR